jgi:aryl-alcohol dehydrogenase-like predicted oxidoreductase
MSAASAPFRLVLGGHSFIRQLGNDPALNADQCAELVAACLDCGIAWFDTTYQPERIALGQTLHRLGRRNEARIIAWNFFVDFDHDAKDVGGADYYRPHHLELMLDQLQTDYIDDLVVHDLSDSNENARQRELAMAWRSSGKIKRLGTWAPKLDSISASSPYRFLVQPFNIATELVIPQFAAARNAGWESYACSPFVRGWKLDELVRNASSRGEDVAAARARIADHLLRYSLFESKADRLIVSMRSVEWVRKNVDSVRRGPLSDVELAWLRSFRT